MTLRRAVHLELGQALAEGVEHRPLDALEELLRCDPVAGDEQRRQLGRDLGNAIEVLLEGLAEEPDALDLGDVAAAHFNHSPSAGP